MVKRFIGMALMLFGFLLSATEYRTCLLFIDESENVVNNNLSATSQMISALIQARNPIIASASLWRALCERKAQFLFLAQQEGSDEAKALNLAKKLQDRLCYWQKYYTNLYPTDRLHIQTMIAQELNQEFFMPEARECLKKEHGYIPSEDMSRALAFYFLQIPLESWQVYRINESYHLFIPSHYVQACGNNDTGFYLKSLERIENPLDLSHYPVSVEQESQSTLLMALQKCVKPKHMDPAVSWIFYMAGHGSNQLGSLCGISIAQFQEMLQFFNKQLYVHAFLYSSCYAGGQHLIKPYQDADGNQQALHFPVYAFALQDSLTFTTTFVEQTLCRPSYLRLDHKQDYWLCFHMQHDWDKLLNQFKTEELEPSFALTDQCNTVTDRLSNLPMLRPALAHSFMPVLPANFLRIDCGTAAFHDEDKHFYVMQNVWGLMMESPAFTGTLVLKSMPARILSLFPGSATHYTKKIIAQNNTPDELLYAVRPLEGQIFSKYYLFDSAEFAYKKESSFFKAVHIDCEGSTVIFTQVMIFNANDNLMRFTAAYNNNYFSGHATLRDNRVIVKNLYPLSVKAAEAYVAFFTAKKEAALEQLHNNSLYQKVCAQTAAA